MSLTRRTTLRTTTEPLKQNQFGGTFGGPIRKDKTFFFGYYEGFRNRQGETHGSTVPSARTAGQLRTLCPVGLPADISTNPIHQLYNCVPPPPALFQQPFDLSILSPLSQNLLGYFPAPNNGTNVYTAPRVVTTTRTNSDCGSISTWEQPMS